FQTAFNTAGSARRTSGGSDFPKPISLPTAPQYMFSLCRNLSELDLSGLDTSAVTNMYAMFQNCTSLEEL
ncbi:BspA family leucine-rich repeat surface protein, partial [Escherichia coli]|uniref:BspA family leucine-rich repeat surface protein n=1 Tax=Escherichia coli TaxID=562 RepID=UPI0015F5275B